MKVGYESTTVLVNGVNDPWLKLYENYIPFLVLLDHTKVFHTVKHKILLLFIFTTSLPNWQHIKFVKRWQKYSPGIIIRASFVLCIHYRPT